MVRIAVTLGMPGHLNFDRNGHIALHLLGRLPGALNDDVDERRYRIRVGLDVEVQKADEAGAQDGDKKYDDEDTLLDREGDDAVHVAALNRSGELLQLPVLSNLSIRWVIPSARMMRSCSDAYGRSDTDGLPACVRAPVLCLVICSDQRRSPWIRPAGFQSVSIGRSINTAPLVTTRSPARSPVVISAMPFATRPAWTLRISSVLSAGLATQT